MSMSKIKPDMSPNCQLHKPTCDAVTLTIRKSSTSSEANVKQSTRAPLEIKRKQSLTKSLTKSRKTVH